MTRRFNRACVSSAPRGTSRQGRGGRALLIGTFLAAAAACRARDPRHVIGGAAPLGHAPPGFFWGAASSAYQTEGGNDNDWSVWERGLYPDGRPHVADGHDARRATDAWNHWPADVAAARAMGANMVRLGIEWSRLEPVEGRWDEDAAARYRSMLQALRSSRPQPIEPLLTLWHFTMPRWLAARGGWEAPDAVEVFARYVAHAAAAFGDLVDWWCTLNEPNVYVAKGFLAADWPPGVRDPQRAATVLATLLRAHARAAAVLRRGDRLDADGDGFATRIGLAHNVRIFSAASPWAGDGLAAAIADTFYNDAIVDAVARGRIRLRLPGAVDVDQEAPALIGSFDYLGLNYYTREWVEGARPGGPAYRAVQRPGRERNDMGWEIYPEGLYRLLMRYRHRGWPLFVTENGTADASGERRPAFLLRHVAAVERALADGAPVIGYLVWSLTDNFEWSHGYQGRFGLYAVDFASASWPTRRPTPAAATFAAVARTLGLQPDGTLEGDVVPTPAP